MNTDELRIVLQMDEYCKYYSSFVGAKDECMNLPFSNTKMVICNTDTAKKPGTHWFALFKVSQDTMEYFDSYGSIGIDGGVKEAISTKFANIVHNDQRLQGTNSSVCGQYSLLYLLLRGRGYSMVEVIQMMLSSEDYEERDHIVNKFINSNFSHLIRSKLRTHDFSFMGLGTQLGSVLCSL